MGTGYDTVLERIATRLSAMVPASEASAAARPAQLRLIATAFLSPLLVPLVAGSSFAGDLLSVLAITCAAVALGWGLAVIVIATGGIRVAGSVLAVGWAAFLAAAIAAAQGQASPTLLLLGALVAETWFVSRDRSATIASGLLAGAAALAGLAGAGEAGGPVTLAAWAAPMAWGWTAVLRRNAFRPAAELTPAAAAIERLSGGGYLEFSEGGAVSACGKAVPGVTGIGEDELTGPGFFNRILVADRVHFLAAIEDCRAGEAGASTMLRLRTAIAEPGDGSGHLEFRLELAPGPGGGRVQGLIARAVSRRPAAPAMDRDELETAKSRFLAAVSHELRTPLSAIIGFSDMMLCGLFGEFSDPRQREYVGLISASGNHLLNVVNAILDVSKIEAGAYSIALEPFAFADAVAMSVSMVGAQAEAKNIRVANNAAKATGELVADRRAVQQILINLLSNAVKFTPDGGAISVDVAERPGMFEFSVSDTGIGIPEQDLGKLGRPFMQIENDLTRSFDGTGLGLSLVKGLVELHRGTLSIESAVGEGTTVRVGLPNPRKVTRLSDIKARKGGQHAPLRKTG